jgi:hypothetical protein
MIRMSDKKPAAFSAAFSAKYGNKKPPTKGRFL